jgi:tetratricopeptide (TPR) repeat protein
VLLFNRGEFERAAESFEAVLREVRDPNDPDHCLARVQAAEARANLGLAFFHAGDFTRAEREFGLALEEHPTFPDLRYYRARIRERSGRLAEAVADLEQAVNEQPHYLEAHLLLAVCRGQLGERERSAAALQAALELGWAPPAGLDPAAAAQWSGEAWRQLLAPGPAANASGPLHAALQRHAEGDLSGAIADLARAVDEKPTWADLRARLAGLLLEAGRTDEALAHLAVALERNPGYLEARLLATRAELERGRAAEAEAHATAALAKHPDYPDLHFWLGLVRFRAGDLAGAVAPLERATELNRQFARAQRLLGLVYHALGRYDDALRAVRRGLSRDREVPGGDLEPALLLLDAGDFEGAEQWLLRTVALRPQHPDVHVALARARRGLGRADEARAAYREALRVAPGYDAAALEAAALEIETGHAGAAEELLVGLVARRPGWADAHALLGRARLLGDRAAEAEAALREALRLHPGFAAAHADLGWALLRQGRAADADAAFGEALELDPLHALPRQQLEWRELLVSARDAN